MVLPSRTNGSKFTQPLVEIAVERLSSCMLRATFFLVAFFVITIIIQAVCVTNGGGGGGAIMKLPVMRRRDASMH